MVVDVGQKGVQRKIAEGLLVVPQVRRREGGSRLNNLFHHRYW